MVDHNVKDREIIYERKGSKREEKRKGKNMYWVNKNVVLLKKVSRHHLVNSNK